MPACDCFPVLLNISLPPLPDFKSLFDLEHDLPDELISSADLGLVNGGDVGQLQVGLPGGAGGQDAAAKHKQLSELLRTGGPPASAQQQAAGGSPGGGGMGLLSSMKASPAMPGIGVQQQHVQTQQGAMMQQQGMLNRGMMGPQKGNGQPPAPTPAQQQVMMGGQVMNGSPRMAYSNPGMGSNSNSLLAETLQQQQLQQQQLGAGAQTGMRGTQQPAAMNKVPDLPWGTGFKV